MDASLVALIGVRATVGAGLTGVLIHRIRNGGGNSDVTGMVASFAFGTVIAMPVLMDDWFDDAFARATGVYNLSSWLSICGYTAGTLFLARLAETISVQGRWARPLRAVNLAAFAVSAAGYFLSDSAGHKTYTVLTALDNSPQNLPYIVGTYTALVLSITRMLLASTEGLWLQRRGILGATFLCLSTGSALTLGAVGATAVQQLWGLRGGGWTREVLVSIGMLLISGAAVSYNWEKVRGRFTRLGKLRRYSAAWMRRNQSAPGGRSLDVFQLSRRGLWRASATSATMSRLMAELADLEDRIAP